MSDKKVHPQGGEGDRESARRYNKGAEETASRMDEDDFREGVETEPGDAQAEEKGRERAKEFDPAVKRDYSDDAD